jgi:hypothetical protein
MREFGGSLACRKYESAVAATLCRRNPRRCSDLRQLRPYFVVKFHFGPFLFSLRRATLATTALRLKMAG